MHDHVDLAKRGVALREQPLDIELVDEIGADGDRRGFRGEELADRGFRGELIVEVDDDDGVAAAC
jgi:hypothetical protein